ncbi:MAG: hypothetical protein N3G76_02910, partial [Candidatus Micrarchaeota archaeon]|nr:hypothetical protein [Candidatus Micrarchaeota archaeon]
ACGGNTCSKDSACCNGYGCILQAEGTKKCQPCAAGLDCSRQQCCPGMQCTQFPDGTKKCLPCAGRQCASQSDCCKGDMCVNGQCRSLSSCAGVPCTTPGESCKLCADVRDPATCSRCTDNTICANDGSGKFVCQPACQAGGVVCGTCQTGCCDPLTGKCACGPGEHACENVEGCACCTYGAQTVQACPQGMLMCPGYGCAPPFICTKDPVFKISICRPTTDIKCEKGTFECAQHKNACCTYIVPADAIPPGISAVDTKTCPSGYGIIMQFDRGSANFRKFVCCEKVSYKLEGKTYQYSFTCGGSTYTGTSAASSYEYMVSTTKALSENFCKEVASTCAAQGIPLEQCFTKPIQAQVGGS